MAVAKACGDIRTADAAPAKTALPNDRTTLVPGRFFLPIWHAAFLLAFLQYYYDMDIRVIKRLFQIGRPGRTRTCDNTVMSGVF